MTRRIRIDHRMLDDEYDTLPSVEPIRRRPRSDYGQGTGKRVDMESRGGEPKRSERERARRLAVARG